MNGPVSSAVAEKPGHAHGIGIVVFQPLLSAKRKADRRFQLARERNHLVACIAATVAPEDRHIFRVFDHPRELFEIGIGGTKNWGDWDRDVMNTIGGVGGGHIARQGNCRWPAIDHSGQNRGVNHRSRLLRIHNAPNIEACGIEKFVRVQLFERSRVDQLCFHATCDRNDRRAILPGIH